jgi:hypothetical protein
MAEQAQAGGQQAGLVKRTGRFGDDKDPNMGADTQFRPGQSGNPKGRAKGPTLSTQIQNMMNDEGFIDRLSEKLKEQAGIDASDPDPEFQSTPMKAIITAALIEAMNPNIHPDTRNKARTWVARFGYGTKIDITSAGERLSETPKIISIINARPSDTEQHAE